MTVFECHKETSLPKEASPRKRPIGKADLRLYEKRMTKWPKSDTQFKTVEGQLTLQSCGNLHPLIYAWLESKRYARYVLCCPICRCYTELLV